MLVSGDENGVMINNGTNFNQCDSNFGIPWDTWDIGNFEI